jgi:stearoyl-CoA desaturase (delta-9 desaturase)
VHLYFLNISAQYPIAYSVREHRVHHRYSETDADPYNARRGFFFSHVGWLMQKTHPEVLRRKKQVDMSDVLADPVVQFEER